ncbi:TonB-dependent receptor plug domain-containing protein [Phenylobacterium sp.]|jgi:hypothetical protein|uniref:TonB-dependent receptor plug domain-containing protein n=1 Tax=Phenylobacterium sp. TaxID=1871053 RepID=UPI002F3E7A33
MPIQVQVRRLGVAAGLALAAAAGSAFAQVSGPPNSSGRVVYDPAAFAAAKPESAYDMVLLVPGFAFDPGDQDSRGLASSAGNVLIDGKRPAAKTDTLANILRRIPAGAVARIELIRGGGPGVDMQGHTVLANVVRGASTQVISTSDARLTRDGRLGYSTRLDASRQRGQEGMQGSLRFAYTQGALAGEGAKAAFDGAGGALSQAGVHIANPNTVVTATGEVDTKRLGGLLQLKAFAVYGTNRAAEEDHFTSSLRQDLITSEFRTRHLEVSADYTRQLTPKAVLEVIGVQNIEHLSNNADAEQAGLVTNSRDEDTQGESILRSTVTYTGGPRWSLEAGGEYAYNFLDGRSGLIVGGVPQPLPSADVQVAESRAEAFATLTWRPGPKLTLEAGSRFEVSRLTVTGDADNSASFDFPKPRLLATWAPDEADQFRLRLERTVSQLSFEDFVTTSSLDLGVITGGNPRLAPERDWIAEAAWDRRFGKVADLVLTVSHAALQDVIDELPVAGLSGVGNIGDGSRDRADLNLTLPLDAVGLKGGQFKAQGTWIASRVTDPTTHARRVITNDQPFAGVASITGEVPRLRSSWRIDLTSGSRFSVFRIDEIDRFRSGGLVSLLWEWKPSADLAFQAQLQSLGGADQDRQQLFFAGLRNASAADLRQIRDLRTGPRLYLRIRKTL